MALPSDGANSFQSDGRGAPYAFTPTYWYYVFGQNTEWYAPDSYHAGGVQYAIEDGSTRFVADSIAWQPWVDLNTRSNGVTSTTSP